MAADGVYPNCGSACVLLNRPCNYGKCEDLYNDFKCNCSISPYNGKYCQNSKLIKTLRGFHTNTLFIVILHFSVIVCRRIQNVLNLMRAYLNLFSCVCTKYIIYVFVT